MGEWEYNRKVKTIWFKHLPLGKTLVLDISDWYEQLSKQYDLHNTNPMQLKGFASQDVDELSLIQCDEVELSLWRKGFYTAWDFCTQRPSLSRDKAIRIHLKRESERILRIEKIEQ